MMDTARHILTMPDALYMARSPRKWRTPVFHLAARCLEWYVPLCCDPQVAWEDPSIVETLPEGCELCQRCAERVAFLSARDAERATPDRGRYNDRTAALLQMSGVKV